MKSILLILSIVLFALISLPQQVFAQQPPEAQRMDGFVGEWTFDDMDGGSTCNWLGDFTIHCQGSWTTDTTNTAEVVFLTRYDPEAEVYTAHRFYSGGYTDSGLGWLAGDTWTFVYEGSAGARYRIISVITGDTWTYEWHKSVEGGAWERTGGGSMTKVK